MEGKKVCQRYLSKNLGPVHTYPDIFEKRRKKTHCGVKWLRAKGTKPPLIEYHELNACNMHNRYQPSKGEGHKTRQMQSALCTQVERSRLKSM